MRYVRFQHLLSQLVRGVQSSAFRPEAVVAVGNGLTVAHYLAVRLGVAQVVTAGHRLLQGEGDRELVGTYATVRMVYRPTRVLLVQDVVASHMLMGEAAKAFAGPEVEVRTAALMQTFQTALDSSFRLDYVVAQVDTAPTMPWETASDS